MQFKKSRKKKWKKGKKEKKRKIFGMPMVEDKILLSPNKPTEKILY